MPGLRLIARTLLLALLCAAAGSVSAQCPPQTSVADTIYNADGSPAEGRVVIAWPTFQAGSCQVVAGQMSVKVAAGALSVPLYPNESSTPSGTSYRVTYYLQSGRVTTEYWVVPASATPVSLALVRSSSVPVPAVMVSQAQVTNLVGDLARKVELPTACAAGKFLQATGAGVPPQVTCVDGTGAPLASPALSGTVKTDVSEPDPLVYTKASTDGLLAGKAAASHPHAAADITSGVLDPGRVPVPTSATLGGVKSAACSGTDKVNGISTAGGILCGTDQTGGGTGGSQHQVNGLNLAANDPVSFQDSATIAFTNPALGIVEATLRDSSVTATKLAASSPSAAQLSGIDDDNIPPGALSANRVAGVAEVQANKGSANGYPSLNASLLVVQNPAAAQSTPAALKIPIADGTGKLDDAWLSSNVSLLGSSISLANEVTNVLSLLNGGTNRSTGWAASRCVRVNDAGTALEPATSDCGAGSGLGDPGANGVVVRTALNTTTNRIITGTGSNISVTNGDGVSGNPTIDVGSAVVLNTMTVTRDFPLQCSNPRVKSLAGNAYFDVEGLGTADVDLTLARFTNNVDGRITCTGFVPNELAATPAAKVIFDVAPHVACGASQNFRFNIRYRFNGATGNLDTALTAETEQSIAGATTAHVVTRATFPASGSLSSAPAAGNLAVVEIQNNGASASDTCEQSKEIPVGSVKLRVDVKVKN